MPINSVNLIQNINNTNVTTNEKTEAKKQFSTIKTTNREKTLRDSFVTDKQKSGLVEKLYDYLKNKTGIGIGSEKVEGEILDFEQGKISEAQAKNTISKFNVSKENAGQSFGDVLSTTAALGTYYTLNNFAKHVKARIDLKTISEDLKYFVDSNTANKILDISKKITLPTNAKIISTGAAMFSAGLTKYYVMKFNRAGSTEYKLTNDENAIKKEIKELKANKKESKEEIKSLKKEQKNAEKFHNKQRHKQNFKNFATGSLNGLLAPITGLAGGIVGIPAFLATNLGLRYSTSKNDNKPKSFNNFIDTIKDNIMLDTLATLALAVPAFKKVTYSKILEKNLQKVVKKLKDANFEKTINAKTAYKTLEEKMINSTNIKKIFYLDLPIDKQIEELTKENIFAVKFLQISNDYSTLSKALRENCPATRTIDEAQKEISKVMGEKYSVTKLLGVGTIAESYLAKDTNGNNVCIKIIKKGISAAKIQKDKEAFRAIIKNGASPENLTNEQKYLLKNIENLAEGINKEVDFNNEMEAAKKLANFTKKANVVKPIEVKDGVYVMECANGISLETMVKYYNLNLKKMSNNLGFYSKKPYEIEQELEALKAKSPDFDNFNLSNNEIKKLLKTYIDVMTEQFNKVEKGGKTLHADIHPGNIFIDINALKSKKGKIFTLIDTGNTVDLNREQTLRSLQLTNYIRKANTKDITQYVLSGAILPKGLTMDEAVKLVENDLNKLFFDNKSALDTINNDTLLTYTNNIMQKYSIIPNDTQLNLNKAKTSSKNSLKSLIESLINNKIIKAGNSLENDKTAQIALALSFSKDAGEIFSKYKTAGKIQEIKNLIKMPFSEIIKQLKNPNMHKSNSEEYLTYHIKQNMNKDFSF